MIRHHCKSAAVAMLLLTVALLADTSAEPVDSSSIVMSTDFEDWSLGEGGASKGFFTVRFPFGGMLQAPSLGFVAERPVGNKAYRLSEKDGNFVFISDQDLADFVLSFTVEIAKGAYAVFFRIDPGHDGYLLDGGALGTLRNLTIGKARWFAKESFLTPPLGTYDVRLIAIGEDILVFRDSALVISASNDLFSHGIIGLGESAAGGIYIDDLNLRQVIRVKAVLSKISQAASGVVLHVAILSTDSFDATTELDLDTLTFGKTGDEDSLQRAEQDLSQTCDTRDYDGDGRADVVCPFHRQKAGLSGEAALGVLFGVTNAGDLVGGIVSL